MVLSANGSYTLAEFKAIDAAFQGASAVQPGDAVPDVPRQKFNLGGEYTRMIVADYTGYLHVDWSHIGTVPTGFTYDATRPACSTLDVTLGARWRHYDLSVYGHNLTNSISILEIQEGAGYSYGSDLKTQIATPPRTVGIDLKMHF